jgi:hypothetical protein
MTQFQNSRKGKFLSTIPTTDLEGDSSDLVIRSKFNFSYFCHQDAGQRFSEWTPLQQCKLFDKLVNFSQQPLAHWQAQRVGGAGGTVLAIYKKFPVNSDFSAPPSVPHDVEWGRFRLGGSERLIGFIVPHTLSDREHNKHKRRFDCNTFYVVFLDRDHRFYKSEQK